MCAIVCLCCIYLRTTASRPSPPALPPQVIPTLLRHSHVWSTQAKRLLLVKEHFKVMGIPWSPQAELSENQRRAMAGNAMHMAAIGSVLTFLFVHIERV